MGAPGADRDRWVTARVRLVPDTATRETGFVPTVAVLGANPTVEPNPSYEY